LCARESKKMVIIFRKTTQIQIVKYCDYLHP
jgi:hypothetical protein